MKNWEEQFDQQFDEVSCECGQRELFDFSEVKALIISLLSQQKSEMVERLKEVKFQDEYGSEVVYCSDIIKIIKGS